MLSIIELWCYDIMSINKYHFNNFGGLVLFLCRQSVFSRAFFCVALRGPVGTLPATYGSRETSVVRVLAA